VGVFALVATAQSLWIGSDTERIGRYEHHARIAFMPPGERHPGARAADPHRSGILRPTSPCSSRDRAAVS
jgi:hypothetical protein